MGFSLWIWGYALQSLGNKSLYWQTLSTDIRISETCVIAHVWFTSCVESIQVFSWTCCLLIYRDVLSKWDYVKVKTIRLQGLLLSLFCLRKHLLHLRDIETQYTRTGFGGMWVCVQRDFWSSLKCMLSQIMILYNTLLWQLRNLFSTLNHLDTFLWAKWLQLNPLNPQIKSHLLFAGIIRSSPFSPR